MVNLLSKLSYNRYDSPEDRLIKLTLKLSLLVFVLAIEIVIVLVIIKFLWGPSW